MLLSLTGAVILSSGLASYIHISPLFMNFIVGVTLTNLPNFARGRVSNLLLETEKPFFTIFLILVGALWPVTASAAVGAVLIYCPARVLGLVLGMRIGQALFLRNENQDFKRLGFAMLPQGGVAIALVMDYTFLYPGPHASFALGVVIFAVLMNQLIGSNVMAVTLRKLDKAEGVNSM